MDQARGVLTFAAGAAIGTQQVVAGLAFRPKAIIFEMVAGPAADGVSAGGTGSIGWTVEHADASLVSGGTGWRVTDNATTNICSIRSRTSPVFQEQSSTTTSGGICAVTALAADGFTLEATSTVVLAMRVYWTAIGGVDVTAEAVNVSAPGGGAAASFSVPLTQFTSPAEPNVVLVASGGRNVGFGTRSVVEGGPTVGAAVKANGSITQRAVGMTHDVETGGRGGQSRFSAASVLTFPDWDAATPSTYYQFSVTAIAPASLTLARTATGLADTHAIPLLALKVPGAALVDVVGSTGGSATHNPGDLGFQPGVLVGAMAPFCDASGTTVAAGAFSVGTAARSGVSTIGQSATSYQDFAEATVAATANDAAGADDTAAFFRAVTRTAADTFAKGPAFTVATLGTGATPNGFTLSQSAALPAAGRGWVLALGDPGASTVTKALAGTSTATGTATPVKIAAGPAAKVLAGSSTPSGAVTELALGIQSIGGASTPTGVVNVTRAGTGRSVSGTSAPSGTIARLALRRLTGSSTATGAITTYKGIVTPKALAGSSTATGAVAAVALPAGSSRNTRRRRIVGAL